MLGYLPIKRAGLSLLVVVTTAVLGCVSEPAEEAMSNDASNVEAAACAAAPAWAEWQQYAQGALVRHKDKVYRCTMGHQSLPGWSPDAVPALWSEAGCADQGTDPGGGDPRDPDDNTGGDGPVATPGLEHFIPKPVSVKSAGGAFTATADTKIYVDSGSPEMEGIAHYLASKLKPATGYALEVLTANGAPGGGNIYLTLGNDATLGDEGYTLTATEKAITITSFKPEGAFRGVQTLRQALPASVEASTPQAGPWTMATGEIRDYPRFAWRGAMLDVARHFFSVDEVERYIDLLAYYKINRFHLHLSDDQGWRIAINSWPNLTSHGGRTEVGGGSGGFYTQAEYSDIVAYAQDRYITVIPEIDMPGHTNAALASYAELNCSGVAPALYTGTDVGFSSLCMNKQVTYTFLRDVIGEIASLTPGPYIHIGGDEAHSTSSADYVSFIAEVQQIVRSSGKRMIGWEEIAKTRLDATSIVQHWNGDLAAQGARQGVKVIMSPASRAYLDMKYDAATPLGLSWAGFTDEQDAYTWDPAAQVNGVTEGNVLGVEAPLWSETIDDISDVEYMAFPRLPGHAEIGWSPTAGRYWDEYRSRLGSHGSRWTAMGVNFYKSSQIPWR